MRVFPPHLYSLLYVLFVFNAVFGFKHEDYPAIPQIIWEAAEPYLIPEEHPIKPTLDRLFKDATPLLSEYALQKLGFEGVSQRRSTMIVTKHRLMMGHVFKLFLHGSPASDWFQFIHRIEGANLIRNFIAERGFDRHFKVPRKWLYPLRGTERLPLTIANPKYFILVVEDAFPNPTQKNQHYYKAAISEEKLTELYTIIQENKLIDSVYIDNIPHCGDRKIAFIDTEHYLVDAVVPFNILIRKLSFKNGVFLKKLVENGY